MRGLPYPILPYPTLPYDTKSGIRGIPCMEFYTGSKFALEGITDSMRYSLSAFNISGHRNQILLLTYPCYHCMLFHSHESECWTS